MKAFQLAALFGGVVSAAQPLVGRDEGTTTAVIYVTSTYTVTKCAASVTNCPVASATEVFTSTTVISVTTTICPVTSTPGLPSSGSGSVPSSSAFPTSAPGTTNTFSESLPTSYPPGAPGPSSAYLPPVQSSALPTGPSQSIDFLVSLISPNPSLPVTGTDTVPASSPPGAPVPSSVYTPPVQTSALPTGPAGSDTVVVPRPRPSGSASPPGSLTDSVPTSFPPGVPALSSSIGYVPSQPLTSADPGSSLPTIGTNTGAVPTSGYPGSSAVPSGSNSPSGSSYTTTDAVPTSGYPGSNALPSSSVSSPFSASNAATDAFLTSKNPASSGYGSASSTSPVGTNTYSVPASSSPNVSDFPSSQFTAPETTALPIQGTSSTPEGYPTGSVPVVPSSTLSTVSDTYPAVTSASSGLVYLGPPPPASTTVIDGTTRITSRLTLPSTNYVTAPLPSSNPSTDTATDAVPTSRGTAYLPSGSGYPYPSGSANGTIIAPTPSYIEVPVNMGQIVVAGQSPIVAIVIALAFALFA